MMPRRYQRGPGDRCQFEAAGVQRGIQQHNTATSQLQKHPNEGDRRGSGCGGRYEETGGFVRDTARTSPRSHMVVEMVLYGCVCLSVPFRIFTGKRRRPVVCNNISPPHLPPFPLEPPPSLSLCFCVSLFLLLSQKSARGCHCD